jgi:hypothetical protein
VSLNDRYVNKFAPLNSTTIYPKSGHQLLYTPMTGEIKCPKLYLCLAHSIPSPSSLMQHIHQPITKWYNPLHIIMWLYWFIDLNFTCSSPLLWSICDRSSLNMPFTLATGPSSQVLSWSSPRWSHDSKSCLICNELLHHMCKLFNIPKPFHLHSKGCSHMMYLWTNLLCILLKHILVHLRLSLNYQNKHVPFNLPLFGN